MFVTGAFYVATGSVGIGTVSPSQLFEVVGGEIKAGRIDSSNEGGQISFGRSTDNATAWYIDAYGNTSSPQLRFVNVSNAVVAMTLTGSNVGIGTSSPSALLHLVQSTSNLNIYLQNTLGSGRTWAVNSDTNGKFNIHDTTANRLTITSDGNVGIGTNSPLGRFDVYRAAGLSGTAAIVISSGESPSRNWSLNTDVVTDGDFAICVSTTTGGTPSPTAGNTKFYITKVGDVGIGGTGAVSQRLRTVGASNTSDDYSLVCAKLNGTSTMLIRNDNYAYIAAASWAYGSDLRMKENISDVENGLDMVLKMKPKHFDYIDGQKDNLGFIAQDIQEIIPQAVSVSNEESGMLSLKTDFLVPYLTKAIQELKSQNDALQSRIETLESK
jgi:hypothetical protein